jgi:centromere protein I
LTIAAAASVPAKQRTVKLSDLVTRFCSKAYEEGLPNASLEKLVDIITLPNELDQASVGNLIRNLYPAGKVPDKVVVKVVGSLGHGKTKPSYSSQAALLKWLVMVFDVIENHAVLSRLYDIFFNLLDTVAIRYAHTTSRASR